MYKYVCDIKLKAELIHSRSGNPIVLNFNTQQVLKENSQDYNSICDYVEEKTGIKKKDNPEVFENELANYLYEEAREIQTNNLEAIVEAVKQYYSNKNDMLGCQITFAGTTVDMSEFCTFGVKEFDVHIHRVEEEK